MTISQDEHVSDYDAEWGSDEDTQDESFTDTNEESQSSEEPTAGSNEASADAQEATPEETTDSSAESDAEEDIWASATEAQRNAFRRVENEKTAASNRVKSIGDKLANNGRTIQQLQADKAALEEASRQPTEFEQEHEVYGKDINEMIERHISKRLPPAAPEPTPEEIENNVFSIIETAHPDAGNMYNSSEMQQMLADDPVFKHDGKPLLFSEALHSDDPHMAVIALNHFKASNSQTDQTSGDPREDLLSAEGSSGKHDMRTNNQLSASEQYDREWEEDD